jgi:hypothetical protein
MIWKGVNKPQVPGTFFAGPALFSPAQVPGA